MLKLDRVDTSYGTVPMLRGVSLAVSKGELVCLLGPNGAGKTTTFRAIAGLLRPTAGRITVMGRDLSRERTERLARLGIGFVPEGRRLFPELSVRQNILLGFEAAGGAGDFETRLMEIGATFPRILERLPQPAGTLSGGEQAMVALARALIGSPALVVMDEPSLGLSPRLVEEYFRITQEVNQAGTAVLLIEQNARMALEIAHRGYVLVKGQIGAEGRATDLLGSEIVRKLYF